MSLDECEELLDTVKKTGLTYMMAETSYYHQSIISARQVPRRRASSARSSTPRPSTTTRGWRSLYVRETAQRTWRYGFPPMHYPTHCTAFLVGVTGERLTEVSCIGWGDDDPILKDNAYKNPFWNETALFKTDKGHAFRVAVYWNGAVGGCERGAVVRHAR